MSLISLQAGTTSLHELLIQHPSVCKPRQVGKEIHFFDWDGHFAKGFDHYKSYFRGCSKSNAHYIDSTPDYLSKDLVPDRMNKTFSKQERATKKLVVILREPVAREFSLYEHVMRSCLIGMRQAIGRKEVPKEGWDVDHICGERHCSHLRCKEKAKFVRTGDLKKGLATFSEYIGDPPNPGKSFYSTYLKGFLKYFNRNQIMVINFERLIYNTSDVTRRLCRFMGLSEFWERNVSLPHENAAKVVVDLDCATRDALAKLYDGPNEDLYSLMSEIGAPLQQPQFKRFPNPKTYPCVETNFSSPRYATATDRYIYVINNTLEI